jgi:hypothetical protein
MKALILVFLASCVANSGTRYVCYPVAANAWVSYCRNDYTEWTCVHYLDGRIECSYPTPLGGAHDENAVRR